MTLGEYLENARKTRRLTLQQVGDAIGISKGHLHGIESGRYIDIRLATAAALAVVLGIDIQVLANLSLQAHNGAVETGSASFSVTDLPPGT